MDDLSPIDQGRLALFVLDSIDRQVAKFTDPVQNQQVLTTWKASCAPVACR